MLIAAALVRPEGWFMIPAAAGYLIVMRARSTAQRVAGAGALIAAAIGFVLIVAPIFRGNLQAVGPAEMLQRGQTIWEYDGWRVAMPPNDAAATRAGRGDWLRASASGQHDHVDGRARRRPFRARPAVLFDRAQRGDRRVAGSGLRRGARCDLEAGLHAAPVMDRWWQSARRRWSWP